MRKVSKGGHSEDAAEMVTRSGQMKYLKPYPISPSEISAPLGRHGLHPAPAGISAQNEFVRNLVNMLVGCDSGAY